MTKIIRKDDDSLADGNISALPDCNITVDGKTAENAVWYYATLYPAVAQIQDHVAFYPNKVDSIEEV